MSALKQNFRFAIRQLRKAPGFTLTVVLTLALGIGATTAIFSIVEGVLLRPLPFRDADRLVQLGDHLGGGPNLSVTAREIATYSSATQAFTSIGGYVGTGFELSGGAQPEQINAARITASTFPTLGVEPSVGRVFTTQEEAAHQPLAVISYALWLNRFHLDAHAVGSLLALDRKDYLIIGVMPRSFEFPLQTGRVNQTQLWVPLSLTAEELSDTNAGSWGYRQVARLKDGVTLAQAAQDVDRVAHQVMRDFPPSMASIRLQGDVKPLREFVVADIRPVLRTLFLAVAVVLLIACVNVSGLLLVRAIRRRREYAVHLALGADSSAIIGEAVVEGLLISLGGGVLGLFFADVAIRATLRLLPESMPRIDAISVDAGVAAFALLVALVTGGLCSLAPAFAALRTNLTESLKEGTRGGTGSASHTWLRSVLVVSEVAIALMLLTVSGVFLRSLQKMREVDPGFRAEHVVTAAYQLPLEQYSTEESADRFNKAIVERLSGKPGILAAGLTSLLPASGGMAGAAYTIEGAPVDGWKLKFSTFSIAYGDYFKALNIPVLDGRTFTADDNAQAPLVVIVSQSMARHGWPGQSALGKRMHVGNPRKGLPWATVIGVVGDVKIGAPDEPATDQWYMPKLQPQILFGSAYSGRLINPAGGYIAVRAGLPPEHMTQTLRGTVAEIDPLLALQQVEPMSETVSNIEAPRRFNTDLITAFALGALLLAVTGIYAVVAFSVSLRTQEIAIRMALGAQRTGIARLVLISGAKLALVGCGIGVLGSLAVSRLISSFLFEVSPTDPIVYVVGVAIMMIMALLASLLPATRAASADPVVALRAI